MNRRILLTEDGSKTLFISELNEHYHSIHGAVQESTHVFIRSGLDCFRNEQSIRVFEMGFGTGLNCFLTWLHCPEKIINYHAIELYPIDSSMAVELDYTTFLGTTIEGKQFFQAIHQAAWDTESAINENFILKKHEVDLLQFCTTKRFHLIYFDAFSPKVQPGLWTPAVFTKMYELLIPGGILTTYCAMGEVRRTMQACGFHVERLPGPPGKREILRAIRNE